MLTNEWDELFSYAVLERRISLLVTADGNSLLLRAEHPVDRVDKHLGGSVDQLVSAAVRDITGGGHIPLESSTWLDEYLAGHEDRYIRIRPATGREPEPEKYRAVAEAGRGNSSEPRLLVPGVIIQSPKPDIAYGWLRREFSKHLMTESTGNAPRLLLGA